MRYLIAEEGNTPQQKPGESSICFWMVVVVETQTPGMWYMLVPLGYGKFKSLPFFKTLFERLRGFPGSSDGKASACNVGNLGLIPGRSKIPWRRKW